MKFPVFIFHELVLRLFEVNKSVGKYLASTFDGSECLIETTAGKLKVSLDLLEKQYINPKLISNEEVDSLSAGFTLNGV